MRSPRKASLFGTGLAMVAAATLLVGCGASDDGSDAPPPAAGSTLDDLYQAAVDNGETTVTVYGPSEAQFASVYAEFSKEFPEIEVVTEFLFGSDLQTRLEQESATGQHVADLVHTEDAVQFSDMYATLELAGLDEVPDDVTIFDGKLYNPSLSLYGFAYNQDLLSDDDAPASWADVADSQYLGDLGMSDPTSLAATPKVLKTAYDAGAIDEDWLTDVAGSDPAIYQSTSQMMTSLSTGEFSLTPVAYYGFVLTQRAQGASIGFVVPEDGAYTGINPYGLMDGAPSPNAATLLVSWMLSDDGQASIAADASEYGSMPGAPAPEGLPDLADINLFPRYSPDDLLTAKEEARTFLLEFFAS